MTGSAKLHITGASGTGATTLGARLAEWLGVAHVDTDACYWLPSEPPFTTKRAEAERVRMLEAELDRSERWVLSGSLMGWGDGFMPRFERVVFLYVPPDVRVARLRERERARYGERIEKGGAMAESHAAFMRWARGYDDPGFAGRSLQGHRAWLARLRCPVLEIAGAPTPEESLERVVRWLSPGAERRS